MTTGDAGAEPSMEDILSSIKRIIAEDAEPAASGRARRAPPRPFPQIDALTVADGDRDHEPVPAQTPVAPLPAAEVAAEPATLAPPSSADAGTRSVSDATVEATRDALGSLSRLMVRPTAGSDGTLEGLVREMIRPMISAWLDQNLPRLVQEQVAREIAKITAQG